MNSYFKLTSLRFIEYLTEGKHIPLFEILGPLPQFLSMKLVLESMS
jgi:hypothetical protein